MSYNKLLAGIISYSLLACAICGCAAAPETTTESSKASSVSDSITYLDAADMFTKRDKQSYYASEDATEITLSDSKSTCDSPAVGISDNQITITRAGTYVLSGSLTIHAAYGHGIVSKDDLVITSGTYDITAARHALSGKDSVRIADGVFTLNAKKDGIHSENTDNDEKGFIYIADGDLVLNDGTVTITKSYEGLESKTVTITGGSYAVAASDDGVNASGDGTAGDSSDSASSDSSKEQKMPSGTPPKQPQNSSDSTEIPNQEVWKMPPTII